MSNVVFYFVNVTTQNQYFYIRKKSKWIPFHNYALNTKTNGKDYFFFFITLNKMCEYYHRKKNTLE